MALLNSFLENEETDLTALFATNFSAAPDKVRVHDDAATLLSVAMCALKSFDQSKSTDLDSRKLSHLQHFSRQFTITSRWLLSSGSVAALELSTGRNGGICGG